MSPNWYSLEGKKVLRATKGIIDERPGRESTLTVNTAAQGKRPASPTQKVPREIVPAIKKMSERTKLRLKLAISVVLFASLFLFGKVNLSEVWAAALNADRLYLGIAVAIYLLSVVGMAHRWQLLAAAVGLKKSLLELVQYCYVGMFFNLFLPSTVGGDFSRCYYISKGTGKYSNALYSVVADRTTGIAVLFLMATAGILLGPGGRGLPWQLKW